MTERELLASASYACGGEWNAIARMLKQPENIREYPIAEPYIAITDQAYPKALLALRYPPFVLFYRGNLSLLEKPAVTIVGSRNMLDYGKTVTEIIAGSLAQKYVLVSGLAKGVDSIVHRSAISHGGKTIGITGCGLNMCYPKENLSLFTQMSSSHLILSEYPCFARIQKHHFPWRNRIIAALGQAVIVTQARYRSGTMTTVNEALALSKDIYAVPWPCFEKEGEGCNLLISQGAQILYRREQLQEFAPWGQTCKDEHLPLSY